jgi:hypothetical protein
LQQLKEWVDQQYHEGRNTVIGDEELEEAMRTVTPGLWKELSEKKSE